MHLFAEGTYALRYIRPSVSLSSTQFSKVPLPIRSSHGQHHPSAQRFSYCAAYGTLASPSRRRCCRPATLDPASDQGNAAVGLPRLQYPKRPSLGPQIQMSGMCSVIYLPFHLNKLVYLSIGTEVELFLQFISQLN